MEPLKVYIFVCVQIPIWREASLHRVTANICATNTYLLIPCGWAFQFPYTQVMFCDLSGFRNISANSSPKQTVELLNELCNFYDEQVEMFDVYKMETFMDCLMAVSGKSACKWFPLHGREELRLGTKQYAIGTSVGVPACMRLLCFGTLSAASRAGRSGNLNFAGSNPWLSETNYFKIDIYRFLAWRLALLG